MEFTIKSKTLETLKPKFNEATAFIKKAIEKNRPIWIRHHADADGYSGGVALQNAIIPLIEKKHDDRGALFRYFKRLPSKTPYYDYEDATKDIINVLENKGRFRTIEPLMIVVDNGSTEEDVFALEKLQAFNFQVVVVDHHDPGELTNNVCTADKFISHHINPHLADDHNSKLTAGMLSVELAHFINPTLPDQAHIACISGIGDKSTDEEYEQYFMRAEKNNFTEQYLRDLTVVIDYESYNIRFSEARKYVDVLFGQISKEQQALVKVVAPKIHQLKEEQFRSALHFVDTDETEKFIIAKIPINKLTNRGVYPSAGKIAGMVREHLETSKNKGVVAMGINEGSISFRISDYLDVDAVKIIKSTKQSIPHALVTGGGHARACSMRFHAGAKDDVLKEVLEKVTQLGN